LYKTKENYAEINLEKLALCAEKLHMLEKAPARILEAAYPYIVQDSGQLREKVTKIYNNPKNGKNVFILG
jgi:hypothetical protein